jgi:hypothetical protein
MELIVCELKLFFEAYPIVKSLLFFVNWKCSFEFPFTLIKQLNWYIPFWGAVKIPVEGLYPCLLFVLTSSNFKMALTPVSEVSFYNEAKNTGRSLWWFTVKRKNISIVICSVYINSNIGHIKYRLKHIRWNAKKNLYLPIFD